MNGLVAVVPPIFIKERAKQFAFVKVHNLFQDNLNSGDYSYPMDLLLIV